MDIKIASFAAEGNKFFEAWRTYPDIVLRHNIGQDFVGLVCFGIGVIGHKNLILIVQQNISLVLVVEHI